MILVDTSVWIDHLRVGEPILVQRLRENRVFIHPFVIGELACGNLQNRDVVLSHLQNLPSVPLASDDEVLFFIERHQLMGLGIGYVDTHLLAAVILEGGVQLWTRDKRLHKVSEALRLAFKGA